jgi:hypothetical protein
MESSDIEANETLEQRMILGAVRRSDWDLPVGGGLLGGGMFIIL